MGDGGWGMGGKKGKPVKEFPQRAWASVSGAIPSGLKVKARSRGIKKKGAKNKNKPPTFFW